MVPVVPLVHLDPPWTAISGVWLHEVVQAGSRWSRGGPGAPAGPWCWVLDQEHSGPLWSTKTLFPDACVLLPLVDPIQVMVMVYWLTPRVVAVCNVPYLS